MASQNVAPSVFWTHSPRTFFFPSTVRPTDV